MSVEPLVFEKLTVGNIYILVDNLGKTIEENSQLNLQDKQTLTQEIKHIAKEIRELSDRLKSVFEINTDDLISQSQTSDNTITQESLSSPEYIPTKPDEYLRDSLVRSFFELIHTNSQNLTLENLDTLARNSNCPDLRIEIDQSSFPTTDFIDPSQIEIESYKCPSKSPYWTVHLKWRDRELQIKELQDSTKNEIISRILSQVDRDDSPSIANPSTIDTLLPRDHSAEEYSLALEKSAFAFLVQ